ncbi:MAG: alpha-hydroxy-acid oxidizing protein [Acetobacteraceae bacterium]|nr:alpha-hydroxy-acid oxidizing protein [Acetobacteraceae bacterium]
MISNKIMRNIASRDRLAWEHVALIRRRWKGKLLVKGLLRKEDARMARDIGWRYRLKPWRPAARSYNRSAAGAP